jgi:drug/metabolite transporter (DMT)-like permease
VAAVQRLSRAARADQLNIPVFEVLLARSVFLLAFALAGCAVSRCNPFGHRCAPAKGLGRRALPVKGCRLWRGDPWLTRAAGRRRRLLTIRGIFGFGAIMNCARPARRPFVPARLLPPRALTAALRAADLVAVIMLPLNDAMVLTFTAPIWAAVLSPFVIKEQPSRCARAPARCRTAPAQCATASCDSRRRGTRCAGTDARRPRARSATFFAILLCMAGVTLISRPSFLGFLQDVRRPYLGVFFALFQVRCNFSNILHSRRRCTTPQRRAPPVPGREARARGAAGAVLGHGQDVRARAAHRGPQRQRVLPRARVLHRGRGRRQPAGLAGHAAAGHAAAGLGHALVALGRHAGRHRCGPGAVFLASRFPVSCAGWSAVRCAHAAAHAMSGHRAQA